MIRGKRPRSGASLQRRRAPIQWCDYLASAKKFSLVFVAVALAVLLTKPLQSWLERPVGAVKISSQLQYVKQNSVIAVIEPLLQKGYWQTDLAVIEQQLENLTWVDTVMVRRVWPDSLVVDITEQQAIARWDIDKLISYRGNVFRPDSIKGFEKLPRLLGPVDSQAEVMQQFSVLSDVLRANQLQLVALALDAQGNWRAELAGDVIMEFGGGDLMEKMQRFLLVYRHSLQPRFEQVARIDLRYGSGLAVAWREVSSPTVKTVERQG